MGRGRTPSRAPRRVRQAAPARRSAIRARTAAGAPTRPGCARFGCSGARPARPMRPCPCVWEAQGRPAGVERGRGTSAGAHARRRLQPAAHRAQTGRFAPTLSACTRPRGSAGAAPPPHRIRLKSEKMRGRYSVLNECPQEHDLVTFGLLILNPEPMRLSM